MQVELTKSTFNGGEWSPALYSRYAYPLYESANRKMRNFYSHVEGPAVKKPGTEYICPAKYQNKKFKFFEFQYGPEEAYALEVGEKYIRFYTNGGQVVIDGKGNLYNSKDCRIKYLNNNKFIWTMGELQVKPYEVATPYLAKDLDRLNMDAQSFDCLYIYHPDYKPGMLVRYGHINWKLEQIKYGSSVPAPKNLKASGEGSEDSYIVTAVNTLRVESKASNSVKCGKESSAVSLSWTKVDDAEYYNIYKDKNNSGSYFYIGQAEAEDSESPDRITFTEPKNKIDPDKTKGPPKEKKPFEKEKKYPGSACFLQQRLISAGTIEKPNNIYGSVTADFYNHNISAPLQDDDSYTLQVNSREAAEIRWLYPMKVAIIGASTGIWVLQPGSKSSAITCSNFEIIQASATRVDYQSPILIDSSLLFVDSSKRGIRDFNYSYASESYNTEELTVLCRHIFDNDKIIDVSCERYPDSHIYAALDSGKTVSVNYVREHKVCCVSVHETLGKWETFASIITNNTTSETYTGVKRTINGETRRYIELFKEGLPNNDVNEAWYVDSGLKAEFKEPVKVIGNLEHLEGYNVCGLFDGEIFMNLKVIDGKITLPYEASTVIVGLPYESNLVTLDFTTPVQNGSDILQRVRRITHVGVDYYQSGLFEISIDGKNWVTVELEWEDEFPTGMFRQEMPAGDGDTSRIYIRSKYPVPLTINALRAVIDITEEVI